MLSEHFYTSPYGLTEVLTRTSMLITELYTNSQNIFLCGISFQRPCGLRTVTTSRCTPICAPVYAPVRPNRSVPTDSVLGLHNRSGQCWACISTQKKVILGVRPTWLQATQVFGMPLDSHVINTIREDLKTDVFAQAFLAQIDPSRASCSQSQKPGTD